MTYHFILIYLYCKNALLLVGTFMLFLFEYNVF